MLAELKKHFELIIFTSSSKIYCEGIFRNVIEANETFFDFKLFKNHLVQKPGGKYPIKNLDILLEGRTLKDIVIVDNRSSNYSDHVCNGIPILEYIGDKNDKALLHLKEYLLNRILHAEDVRKVIKEDFINAVVRAGNGYGEEGEEAL